jgi:hypothetical protein
MELWDNIATRGGPFTISSSETAGTTPSETIMWANSFETLDSSKNASKGDYYLYQYPPGMGHRIYSQKCLLPHSSSG